MGRFDSRLNALERRYGVRRSGLEQPQFEVAFVHTDGKGRRDESREPERFRLESGELIKYQKQSGD